MILLFFFFLSMARRCRARYRKFRQLNIRKSPVNVTLRYNLFDNAGLSMQIMLRDLSNEYAVRIACSIFNICVILDLK